MEVDCVPHSKVRLNRMSVAQKCSRLFAYIFFSYFEFHLFYFLSGINDVKVFIKGKEFYTKCFDLIELNSQHSSWNASSTIIIWCLSL